MTRRLPAAALALAAAAALVLPAASFAGDAGTSAAAARPGIARAGAVVRRIERRLDRRFRVFAAHCLGPNAPHRCSTAASHVVTRLGNVQAGLERLKAKIADTCGASGAPPRCTHADAATARIDGLLAKITSDLAAVKAAFPDAG